EGRKIRTDIDKSELIDEEIKRTNPTIDSEFVNDFYAGGNKNNELFRKLNKKENILIYFPNPVKLIKEFTKAQKKFTEIIANNEIVRDLLENKTTIENHFTENE